MCVSGYVEATGLTIHPETPPPVSPGGEHSTEDRTNRCPNCPHDRCDSKIEAAVSHREGIADNHVDQNAHAAGPNPLDAAARNEGIHIGREGTQQATGKEEGLSNEHDWLTAPYISHGAPNRRHSRTAQDKRPADPDISRRRLELGGDGRYRRRDHR